MCGTPLALSSRPQWSGACPRIAARSDGHGVGWHQPVRSHAVPAARRSVACCSRHDRNASTASGVSGTVRRLRALLGSPRIRSRRRGSGRRGSGSPSPGRRPPRGRGPDGDSNVRGVAVTVAVSKESPTSAWPATLWAPWGSNPQPTEFRRSVLSRSVPYRIRLRDRGSSGVVSGSQSGPFRWVSGRVAVRVAVTASLSPQASVGLLATRRCAEVLAVVDSTRTCAGATQRPTSNPSPAHRHPHPGECQVRHPSAATARAHSYSSPSVAGS